MNEWMELEMNGLHGHGNDGSDLLALQARR